MSRNETMHLHLGVNAEDVPAVRSATAGHVIFVDGDGWYAWGEKPGEAGNDQATRHIIFETTSEHGAEHILRRAQQAVTLVPETWGESKDVYAVLTDRDDWSQEVRTWSL